MIGILLLFVATPLASAYLAWRGGVSLGRAVVVGFLALPVAMAMWLLSMSLVGLKFWLLRVLGVFPVHKRPTRFKSSS